MRLMGVCDLVCAGDTDDWRGRSVPNAKIEDHYAEKYSMYKRL